MITVIIAASVLIGISLGILGGGGSILTVPILVYLAGLEAKQAIGDARSSRPRLPAHGPCPSA
jgi:uncharacterized membrane protein YfcA